MLKKLALPLFALAFATYGCSSSTTPTSGTGGSSATGGTTGKGGGAGATATGGTGGGAGSSATGGSAGGTGGGAGSKATGGTSGGGTSGGGTSGGGTSGGGGAKATDAGLMADCNVTDSTGVDTLTAPIFCANLLAYCSSVSGFTLPGAYANEAGCEAAYKASNQEHCRSYHLCWGVEGITNTSQNPSVHCPHAVGMGLCMATDASTGN